MALAIAKAGLGLIEVFGHYGDSIEGRATLTYYEPAANWLIMVALLGVVALALARVKPPWWVLLGSPLLLASLRCPTGARSGSPRCWLFCSWCCSAPHRPVVACSYP